MASRHDRTIASFDPRSRGILTNGGTVKGGNGLTYRYDPLSGSAVPVSAPGAPVARQPATPTRQAPPQRKGLPTPGERAGFPGATPSASPVSRPPGVEAGDPLDPNDKDGNGVPDYIDEQRKTDRRNALELLKGQFKQYGLDDPTFVQYIHDLLVQGYDASTISLLLQDHQAYKERFKGNEARRAKGLGVLSPAEYIAVEGAYAQILRASGLPAGFYDDPKSDFADWIGKDVSPAEIKERADLAVTKVNDSNPEARRALAEYYGVTDSMLAAYYLDDKRALPILRKQSQAADIGAAAARAGLSLTDRSRAEGFADLGVDGREAQQAYGQIGGFLGDQQAVAQRFGDTYSQTDAEDELLGGMASARRKRERLNQKETALFEGSGGVGRNTFSRNTSGSY